MKKNLYELLEVSPDATPEDIRLAMLRLGKIYATKGQMNEAARAHFNQIKKAYQLLSNPYRRAGYDRALQFQSNAGAGRKLGDTGQRLKEWFSLQWYKLQVWKKLRDSSKPRLTEWDEANLAEQEVVKGWLLVNQIANTQYVKTALIPGEKIIYQAATHWLIYLDIGAILLLLVSSYLLISQPEFVQQSMPMVSLWVPKLLSKQPIEIRVWEMGLSMLLFISLLILWEVFVGKQTTELVITSKRIIAKSGLVSRQIVEIRLQRFESILVEQGVLGKIFNYGTITITGMGGCKTMVPSVIAPLKFKKVLWQVLDHLLDKFEES